MSGTNQHSELHAEAQRLLEDGPRGDVWTEAWVETAKDVIASLIEQVETLTEQRRLLELQQLSLTEAVMDANTLNERLEEQSETLDEALREILDVTEKWTRRMTNEERLLRIDTIAKAALPEVSKTKR